MANDRNMINAFDDAIERLATGEDLDQILEDYPDYADHLRDLLLISTRVAEVHNEDDSVVSAQSRGRDRLQQALKEKPKRTPRSRPRWYMTTVAVATVVLIFGAGLLFAVLIPSMSMGGQANAVNETRMSLLANNATTESLIRATNAQATVYTNATQIAMETTPLLINATATSLPTQAPPTIEPPPAGQSGIVTTSVASMPTITPQTYAVTPVSTGDYALTAIANMTVTADAQLSDTDGVEGGIKTTSMPVPSNTPMMTSTATGTPTSTTTPAPTQTLAGTTVADGTLLQTATVMPSIATGLPALIPLSAGEIDDNADWDTYLRYRQEFLARNIPVRDIDVTGRQIITVVDELNRPVLDATVSIFLDGEVVWQTNTYADGRTMFFPNTDSVTAINDIYTVVVTKDDASTQFTLDRRQSGEWRATLPTSIEREAIQLDVLFLIDTTSSMADEIMQLQNNILHISSEVDAFADNVDVRYGLVLYREHDNFEYLTRRHDFITEVSAFQNALNQVIANSGDNNPDWDEALNVGLYESLDQMSWREDDTIKLIFLVADARPHLNHPLEPVTYDQSILEALERGIKIYPIASSGLEQAGEYIFRQIAQVTMGHFIFLTYDDGVVGTPGNDRPEFDVGQPDSDDPIGGYTVDQLSDIVLRLIQDELAAGQLNRP